MCPLRIANLLIVFGTVYLIQAVAKGETKGGWTDFYGFNRGGHWRVSIVVMMTAGFALAQLLAWVHNLLVV